MKSSTLRRSNLTKERLQTIELLSKYRRKNYGGSTSNLQPLKEKEIDLLWQSLTHSAKEEKSPTIYLLTGFILGAVSMLILTTIISLSVNSLNESNFEAPVAPPVAEESAKLTFIPADTTEVKNLTEESYTVQQGDTLESITIRFYGTNSRDKAKKIQDANNLDNPNAIRIGQKLTIPLN